MEYNERIQSKVGVFVAIGVFLFLTTVLLLGGNRAFLTQHYTLKANFESVQGLASGSVVSLSGVNVGNVGDIEFSPDGLIVSLSIDESVAHKIRKDSVASLKTQGALGDRYIYITPGSRESPPLKEGDLIKTESGSGVLDVLSEQGGELSDVFDVIQESKILLKNLNRDRKSELLMTHLVESSKKLNKVLSQSQDMVQDIRGNEKDRNNLRKGLRHFSNIMRKVDQGEGSLGALVNERSVHDKISSFLGEKPRNQYLKPLIRATITPPRDEE